jgi:hypothetical protein
MLDWTIHKFHQFNKNYRIFSHHFGKKQSQTNRITIPQIDTQTDQTMDLGNPRLHRPPVMGKIYGKMTSPSMSESCSKSQTNPQQSAGPIRFLFDGGTWWYYRLATRFFLQEPKSSTAPPESLPLWTWRKARFARQCVYTLMIYSICGGAFFLGIWCCRIPTMCVCMCLVCLTILFWDNHMWLLKSAVVMLIHGLLARTTGPWEWRIHGLSVARFRLVNQSDLQFECTVYLHYLIFNYLYVFIVSRLQTLMWIDQWPFPQDRKAASPRVVQGGAP